MPFTIPEINLVPLWPALTLGMSVLVLMLADVLLPRRPGVMAALALLGVGAAALVAAAQWNVPATGFREMVVADNFGRFLSLVVLLGAALAILLSEDFIRSRGLDAGAFYALLLGSAAGMLLMTAASDLIVVFLALEMLSLPLYVLAAYAQDDARSLEAGLKYFLLGAFSSAFFLYGIALVYGATGSTAFGAIAQFLVRNPATTLLVSGAALLMVGFGFKVALVPFHWWTPDVYEGAPTPVTAFMSVATKTAAFAAFFRAFLMALPALRFDWQLVLAIVAVLTMTLGNLAALAQPNIKRMLAYSSIAHAGYILIALVVGTGPAVAAAGFYLLAYTVMNLGAFGAVIALAEGDRERLEMADLAGAAQQRPLLAAALAICLLSLAGFPPFAGFLGKFYVFAAAVQAGWAWLAIVAVLNSLISVYFYLGPIVRMYMSAPAAGWSGPTRIPGLVGLAIVLATVATIALGLFPFAALNLAQAALLK